MLLFKFKVLPKTGILAKGSPFFASVAGQAASLAFMRQGELINGVQLYYDEQLREVI
jgi:hypothetical protein